MSNRNLIPVKTSIFRNKLSKILERLQKDKDKIPQQTREAIVTEAVRLLSTFYKTVNSPQFKPVPAISGTKPELEEYNTAFEEIKDDVEILFAELENLEAVVVEQFNLITAQANRINSRVKKLNSRITDFSLFSKLPIKNAIFFSDSFNDTSKVEPSSPLLNATECALNEAEGIVTLPVNQTDSVTLTVTATPSINSNSNGRPGNNEEIAAFQVNDNISAVLDGNPDTWFEYERVVKEDDGESLVLDLTINLTEEQVINFIRINPNNFGTKTEVEIEEIATSADGFVYKSIKDEIPITGFFTKDEQNVFKLAPSTSKYAGQGLFTFTPRFAKYVKITLRQISPYIINTVQGEQFRYAIGLRDIEIKRTAYESSGELVSSTFTTESEIKKVILRTNEIPSEASELGRIDHQVSFDDGNTWVNIQPLEEDAVLNTPTTAAEIVNVNTEDTNSISTSTPAMSIRHKALLSRNDDAFNESSVTFAEVVTDKTELKSVPLSEPWKFTLEGNPMIDSLAVIDPNYGSRGNPNTKYIVGIGTGTAQNFSLPWENLRLDKTKNAQNNIDLNVILRVFVGGEEWSQVATLTTSTSTSKHFSLSPIYANSGDSIIESEIARARRIAEEARQSALAHARTGALINPTSIRDSSSTTILYPEIIGLELKFGNNTNGLAPPNNALIEILFTEERLFPVYKGEHKSNILFTTSIDKQTISILRRGLILQHTVELTREANIHRLPHRHLIVDADYPIVFTNADGVFNTEIPFLNGQSAPEGELDATGEYSIDVDRGIIFSFDRTDITPGTVTYYYQSQVQLSETDWDWGDELPLHKSVTIKEPAWVPNKFTGYAVPSGVFKINLPNLAIVEGSVNFQGTTGIAEGDNPFLEEVPFIDGSSELTIVIKTEEVVPELNPVANIATFATLNKIHTSDQYNVSFTNQTLFATSVVDLISVNAPGEYFVDRTSSNVHVYTTTQVVDAGSIHYYTADPSKIPTGAYSVDYENGFIYLQRAVPNSLVSVDFEYVDYFIRYNIARPVSPSNWTYNSTDKSITISPNEVALRARMPNVHGTSTIRPSTYQINYKYIMESRRKVSDLTKFFTPILKDYILQIVTDDLL
jgi:hypothetical protein